MEDMGELVDFQVNFYTNIAIIILICRNCLLLNGHTNHNISIYVPDNDQANLSNRVPDRTKLFDDVNSNRTYAVFISYCEIYNKYIYDLLDDTRDPITGGPK